MFQLSNVIKINNESLTFLGMVNMGTTLEGNTNSKFYC